MSVLPKKVVPISARKMGECARQLEEKFVIDDSEFQSFLDSGRISEFANLIRGGVLTDGIIAHRIDENTIKLRVLSVNYDPTIEEMVKKLGFNNNSYITSANFSKSKNGKTGTEEVELFLLRLVPAGEVCSIKNVEKAINKAGFISVDLPELSPLMEHCDELWEAGVKLITVFGKSSRWQNPFGFVVTPYLFLRPDYRRFGLSWLERAWRDNGWFAVRRK